MTRKRILRIVARAALGGAAAAIVLAGTAQAAPVTLTLNDGNSSASFCLPSSASLNDCGDITDVGMVNWTVDGGANRLAQQWFWFRMVDDANAHPEVLSSANPDAPIDTLSAPVVTSSGNTATVSYLGSLLHVDIAYELVGGATDSGQATLNETITLTNPTSSMWSSVHFFQYSDFDMCGGGDTVDIANGSATQTGIGCDAVVAQTSVVNPQPGDLYTGDNAYQADTPGNLLTSFANGQNLDDTSSFSGPDAASAFEWQFYLAPQGGSATITLSKSIAPVPEPMTMVLFGTGLLALGRTARRRLGVPV